MHSCANAILMSMNLSKLGENVMVGKKLFTVLFLGILGTLIVIGAVKFLPIQKSFSTGHSATEHPAKQGPVKLISDVKELAKIIKSKKPIAIKFYADWCGACNYVKGPFSEIANELPDVTFYEINVDDQDIMSYIDEHKVAKDGVEALPTFVLRQGDKINDQIVGGMSKEKLAEKIKKVFS